jgi:hypothetical protein
VQECQEEKGLPEGGGGSEFCTTSRNTSSAGQKAISRLILGLRAAPGTHPAIRIAWENQNGGTPCVATAAANPPGFAKTRTRYIAVATIPISAPWSIRADGDVSQDPPRDGCSYRRPLSAVDPPRDAEAVHDGAEPPRPEGLLQGNRDPSAVGELRKDALGRSGVVEIELELETLRAFVLAGEDVAAGEVRAAHRQRSVQDLVAPFGGRLVGHRRVAPRKAERHGAPEALLVEGERRVTLTVEDQTDAGLDSHASIMACANFIVL